MIALAIVLGACSTHFDTSKQEGTEGRVIYRIGQDQAFAIAYNAIATVLPGRKISEIDGPVKGYSTWFRFVLDTYTQQVLVIPATGNARNGERIEGFYFEISGSGSSIVQGRAKNVSIYETIEAELAKLNAATIVSHIERGSYKDPVFASKDAPSAPLQPGAGAVEDRLKELKSLLDRGLISEKEYSDQRAKIIGSL